MNNFDGAGCNTQEYLLTKICLQQVLELLEHMPGRNECSDVAFVSPSHFYHPFVHCTCSRTTSLVPHSIVYHILFVETTLSSRAFGKEQCSGLCQGRLINQLED